MKNWTYALTFGKLYSYIKRIEKLENSPRHFGIFTRKKIVKTGTTLREILWSRFFCHLMYYTQIATVSKQLWVLWFKTDDVYLVWQFCPSLNDLKRLWNTQSKDLVKTLFQRRRSMYQYTRDSNNYRRLCVTATESTMTPHTCLLLCTFVCYFASTCFWLRK